MEEGLYFFCPTFSVSLPSNEAEKMSLYQRARKEERVFLSLTGLRCAEFDELLPFFQAAWQEAIDTRERAGLEYPGKAPVFHFVLPENLSPSRSYGFSF